MGEMNQRLKDGSFFSYYSSFKNKYFLFEVRVSFNKATQRKLQNFVPLIRKSPHPAASLSSYQRDVIQNMELSYDKRTMINLSDFSVQDQSLSLSYLNLLHDLGVDILEVKSVCTAFSGAVLEPLISRILALKAEANAPFLRNLFKLIGVSKEKPRVICVSVVHR